MNCGATFTKYLLFVFNFVFFLSGIAVLAVGSFMIANEDDYVGLIGTNLFTVCVLMIVVGVLVTIIGFFGCCGAIRESKCMLYTYAGLLCLIFVMEFAGGIAAFVYKDDITDQTTTNLNSTMYDYQDVKDIHRQWDDMQRDLHCCGTYNYTDWLSILSPNENQVPSSCCTGDNPKICDPTSPDAIVLNVNNINTKGCMNMVIDEIQNDAVIIGGVAIGIAFIQILGIIFAFCLASAIKD
ncbi:hypothetical protein CHUAL_001232 [Chamberlinius hualienensis]